MGRNASRSSRSRCVLLRSCSRSSPSDCECSDSGEWSFTTGCCTGAAFVEDVAAAPPDDEDAFFDRDFLDSPFSGVRVSLRLAVSVGSRSEVGFVVDLAAGDACSWRRLFTSGGDRDRDFTLREEEGDVVERFSDFSDGGAAGFSRFFATGDPS